VDNNVSNPCEFAERLMHPCRFCQLPAKHASCPDVMAHFEVIQISQGQQRTNTWADLGDQTLEVFIEAGRPHIHIEMYDNEPLKEILEH
jgi:hypothetical protein